jgi:hypothetical protein
MSRRFFGSVGFVLALVTTGHAEAFRVFPYVQNPAADAMTVRWLSNAEAPGTLTVQTPEGPRVLESKPERADGLVYNRTEPGGPHPALPFLHSVRVTGLTAGTRYKYTVRQGDETKSGEFKTAPGPDQPIRFVAYSDPETEPESTTSPPVDWPAHKSSNRPADIKNYVADQTTGYRENLKVIAARDPDFILIAGDLVETGGEQRDWDEFWRHNAGTYGVVASRIPILPSLGNHENYAGAAGGYTAEGADFSTAKYLTYFDAPPNGANDPRQSKRYYRIDYGPITLITLDSSDGLPDKTASDTNHNLVGSHAPDFNPGSEQYVWFEKQLADAQKRSRFTFVQFHHTAYGSGPHSIPFGQPTFSGQSGIAMRVLVPLLFRYGVDVVISGHDEMLERSLVTGMETLADGSTRPHSIHFYDVGIGGDGLRGPSVGFDNPYRQFLAHDDLPEVWKERQLVSGGKHYGHLEVNVAPNTQGVWQAELVPVQVFPLMDESGKVTGWERRELSDKVTLTAKPERQKASAGLPISDDRGLAALAVIAALAGVPFVASSLIRWQRTQVAARRCC